MSDGRGWNSTLRSVSKKKQAAIDSGAYKRAPRKAMKAKAASNEGWYDVALEIWGERPHVCQVSGVPLGDVPQPAFFSHLLPRGSYRKFKRRKDNIWIVSPDIHTKWHEFGPENLQEAPMWQPKCNAYFTLRNEANKIT